MNLRLFGTLLLVGLLLAGCDWFGSKKEPLPGNRISVLTLDQALTPDPALANTPISLPRPVLNPDWPEPGGYPDHAMEHLALPASLNQAWRVSVGEGTSRYSHLLAQPIVAKGRVYAMDGGTQVGAWEAGSGKELWQVDLKPDGALGNGFGGGLAFWEGHLFATTGYGQVLALDPATGKTIWRKDVGAPVHGGPTVADGRIFAVTVENELVVLAADDGRQLWTHNGIPETASLLGAASPAVAGEVVVVPYTSGELFALTIENGRQLWSDNLASARTVDAVAALADIRGRPVIDRGRVFAASHSGRMAAIDVRTGDRLWEQEIGSDYGPWVAGDYAYVLTSGGELVCLAREQGKVRWVLQLPRWENPKKKNGPIEWAGPVLGGNRLIVLSSDGWALSVSPYTGKALGREEMPAGSYLSPVIAGNTLYVLTDSADLSAYR